MPFGYAVDFEFSRMRVESTQLAPTTTTLPSTCRSAPVLRSKYWTPLARPLSSTRTRAATAFERISSLPGLQREGQQVIGGVEERRGVAAARRSRRSSGRPGSRASARVMLARRPGDDGDAHRCRRPSAAAARRSAAPAAAAGTCCPAASRSRRRRRRRRSAARPCRSRARCPRRRSARGSPSRPLAAPLKSSSDRRRLTRPQTLVLPPWPQTRVRSKAGARAA